VSDGQTQRAAFTQRKLDQILQRLGWAEENVSPDWALPILFTSAADMRTVKLP